MGWKERERGCENGEREEREGFDFDFIRFAFSPFISYFSERDKQQRDKRDTAVSRERAAPFLRLSLCKKERREREKRERGERKNGREERESLRESEKKRERGERVSQRL